MYNQEIKKTRAQIGTIEGFQVWLDVLAGDLKIDASVGFFPLLM